jgi:sugar phosphate isomerase/epimerase
MILPNLEDRLAVCSWSLQATSIDDLISKLQATTVNKVNLQLQPLLDDPAWADAKSKLADAGLSLVGGMLQAEGEDYSTMEAIKLSGGVVPDATWPTTKGYWERIAPLAADLGLEYVMFHAGFLPHEPSDENFDKLLGRVRETADLFAAQGVKLGMETGQEAAPTLLQFFGHLDRANVGINFDPANMILYNMGDPIEALQQLAPHVLQIHIKDANLTATPGEWGSEEVVGTGQVDWPAFFGVLNESNYKGFLAIEREAGEQRVADIKAAKEFVLNL